MEQLEVYTCTLSNSTENNGSGDECPNARNQTYTCTVGVSSDFVEEFGECGSICIEEEGKK